MIIFDTDVITLFWQADSVDGRRVRTRAAALGGGDQVCVTIVSFEEQMRGWMAALARDQKLSSQIPLYRRLHMLLGNYVQIPVLDFDEPAAVACAKVRKRRPRMGAMDGKIAAIAIARNALLVTRNTRDFAGIEDLRIIEDWTRLP